jgi:HD-GYP domain-containing protein (c-di-GMP phosphodiesterase class II)
MDQSRLHKQVEATSNRVDATAADDERVEMLIYETAVELMNELLDAPDLQLRSPRLEQFSRSITTLVLNKPEAFRHLYAACRHDYYTATHMVSVATWIVPLAFEMGHETPEELGLICEAGLMHDIGKLAVPVDVLNKKGKLTEEEWKLVRAHPEAGHKRLSERQGVDPMVLRVALEHHERMDGTGYPKGLKGDELHEVSRMCAVVDSFAAMTAFRPFRERPLSVRDAVACLHKEKSKYDEKVLAALGRMMKHNPLEGPALTLAGQDEGDPRAQARRNFQCPALVHKVGEQAAGEPMKVMTQTISRQGLGFLSHRPIEEGEVLRVYIQAKGWEKRALEGRVVRCRTFDDHWHEVGIHFSTLQDNTDAAGPA